jgi:hypothetical protein
MSALATTAVSLYPDNPSSEFYPRGKDDRTVICRRLKLVLTGQGTAANPITAAALGVDKLLRVSNLVDASNNKGYPAAVDPVNNIVLLFDGAAAPAPVDVTAAATYILVEGTAISRGPA